VGTPPTVRVDDDLTTSKTGVTLGTTNNEAARGLDVVGGPFVKEMSWNDRLDNLLLDLPAEVLG